MNILTMLRISVLNFTYKRFLPTSRLASSHSGKNVANRIALTDDESTFVVWHPPTNFPYECTRPLPEPKCVDDTTVLKVQMTDELQEIFNKKTEEQARQELMNITHTTKHRWFARARDKKAKKTEMDREFL